MRLLSTEHDCRLCCASISPSRNPPQFRHFGSSQNSRLISSDFQLLQFRETVTSTIVNDVPMNSRYNWTPPPIHKSCVSALFFIIAEDSGTLKNHHIFVVYQFFQGVRVRGESPFFFTLTLWFLMEVMSRHTGSPLPLLPQAGPLPKG